MAYETKVLLSLLAEVAARTKAKEVYEVIANAANVEGLIIPPYEKARGKLEKE